MYIFNVGWVVSHCFSFSSSGRGLIPNSEVLGFSVGFWVFKVHFWVSKLQF